MKFCPDHWQQLRDAVDAAGLGSLVAEGGDQAAANLASELTEGPTIDNFDPLMAAHNAIVTNGLEFIGSRYQQNPLMLMADGDDPAVTWPTCPICALNWCHEEHDRLCVQQGCNYPKGERYEWMIDKAVETAKKAWEGLRA